MQSLPSHPQRLYRAARQSGLRAPKAPAGWESTATKPGPKQAAEPSATATPQGALCAPLNPPNLSSVRLGAFLETQMLALGPGDAAAGGGQEHPDYRGDDRQEWRKAAE